MNGPNPQRGEIWWVAFDPSVGGEIQKTRPAIIISNNFANRNLNRVIVIPLSSKIQQLYAGETLVNVPLKGNVQKISKAKADQLTTVSKLRLKSRIGHIQPEELKLLEQAVVKQLGILTL